MRNKILIITLFIGVMIIIGTAEATPGIGKVKLNKNAGDDDYNVEVTITNTDELIVEGSETITVNNPSDSTTISDISLDPNGILTFSAHGPNNEITIEKWGHGGCTGNYAAHTRPYEFAYVYPNPSTGPTSTFYLDRKNGPVDASLIQICIYPKPDFVPGDLEIAPSLFGKWVPKHSGTQGYFGFGRISGNPDNIPLNTVDTMAIGTASELDPNTNYEHILMHIYDPTECSKGDNNDDGDSNENTCWRRPGTTIIPEFSTIALPIAAVLGLVFFFQHRKKKEE